MNEEHEQYRDRKLELGLGEILGDQQPPDLSERILAAADEPGATVETAKPAAKPRRWHRWLAMAVAASVLLAIAGLIARGLWPQAPTDPVNSLVAVRDESNSRSVEEERTRHRAREYLESVGSQIDGGAGRRYSGEINEDFDGWRYRPKRPGDTSVMGGQRVRGMDGRGGDENGDVSGERSRRMIVISDGDDGGHDYYDYEPSEDELDVDALIRSSVRRVDPADRPYGGQSAARSSHDGGVRVAFADTHVRDIPEAVDRDVWEEHGEGKGRLLWELEREFGRSKFLDEVENQQQIQTEVLQAEVEHGIARARERFDTDPEGAQGDLRLLIGQIERAEDLDEETRAEIRKQVEEDLEEFGIEYDPVAGANRRDTSRRLPLTLEEQRRLEDQLAMEQAARRQTLAALEARARALSARIAVLEQRNVELCQTNHEFITRVAEGEPERIARHLEDARKTTLASVKELSDNLREAEVIREVLEERDSRLAGELEKQIETSRERGVDAITSALAKIDGAKKKPPKKTWRRAKASPNATRLVVGEKDELLPQGVQANVVVDGFRARVLLDWYYYNDRGRQLEGNFKLRLPNDASLYYLAFGTTSFEYRPQADELASVGFLPADLLRSTGTGAQEILNARRSTWDNVKEARVVPRQKAAYAYGETVRRRVDPALAEWSGAGVFQCRVFPLESGRLHRIVVGYDLPLTHDGDDLVYRFEVPEGLPECAVDLNVSALPGMQAEISPDVRPFTGGGRAYYHFDEPAEDAIVLRLQQPEPMLLLGNDDQAGEFFTTQVQPQLPAGKEKAGSPHAIFLVDTSLSSRPEKFNTYLDLLKAILETNRESLPQFAVLFFNIESHWWQEGYVDNTPENVARLMDHCHGLALEGATDLRQALGEAAEPSWQQGRAGGAPRADLFLLSDGAATWGDDNIHMMSKSLSEGTAGALFAYKTGKSGTATGVLEHLARESGGAVFSVAGEQEVAAAATAHNKRPWTLLDVTIDGGRDVMVAGRPRTIYPDQRLTVVGRGTPDPAAGLVLKVKRGDQLKTVRLPLQHAVRSELAARAYGQVAVGQLEDLMSATQEISTAYARHFRVPGRTCSLLMLDSEADYRRFQIKPEDDALAVSSSVASEVVTRVIDETATKRIDPKAAVLGWLDRLQQTPSFRLNISTATKLAIDKMPASAFEIDVPRLQCTARKTSDLPEAFVEAIGAPKLEYDAVAAEAERRQRSHTSADALKALSSLVENSPGDMVLTRDVAFSAMKWGFGGQAYPLLKRVALARPHQPQVYTAMARCLAEFGHTDLALIYYEVALAGQWSDRYAEFAKIAKFEYYRTLRGIDAGELETSVPEFAAARLDTLRREIGDASIDLVVTMEWNTDRTDVDLHVVEPSGDECSYENTKTKSGGQITDDVTAGFGPEMYTLPNAPEGKYTVKVSYFNSDTNRTSLRTKVYVTVYKHFGTAQEQVRRHVLTLSRAKEMLEVATVGMK